MKKSWFMKCFCLILLLFSGVFFVSCKDNSVPQNQVKDITIESTFFSTKIYQNTQIDLSVFNVYVTNTINEPEVFTLSQIYGKELDTASVGEHSFLLSYNNFSKAFNYKVLPVTMIDARFNSDPIVFYLHEGANLKNATFLALYSDGSEAKIPLSNASFTFENLEVSDEIKTTKATYNNISFSISYVVKTRKIETDITYDFIDKDNYFDTSNQLFAFLSDDKFTVFELKNNEPKNERPLPLKPSEIPNEYNVQQISDGENSTFKIYLTKDGIVMEKV